MCRLRSGTACAVLVVCTLSAVAPHRAAADQAKDSAVGQAIADGDVYESKRKYELALDSYRKADKLSHHTSSEALLKIAKIEKKTGQLSEATNDAKKAIACAQGDKNAEVKARLMRSTLLVAMSGKPSDNKLKEAESELRSVLALQPNLMLGHFNLAMVMLKQGRDPEGIAEMKSVVALPDVDAATLAEAKRIIANPIRARTPFVPDFAFQSHDNQSISNASLRGKMALIDFWGTWCPPCHASVPILKALQKKYAGKGFQLESISSDSDEDVRKTFIASQHMDWTEYLDSSGEVQEVFKVDAFPTYVVVDKDGVVRFRQSGLGSTTQEELEDAINRALKKPSNPALAAAAAAGSDAPVAEDNETEGEDHGEAKAADTSSKNAASSAPLAAAAPVAATPAESAAPSFEPPEGGVIGGNIYTNRALGMRFEFPSGWVAAKIDELHATNEQMIGNLKTALAKQHPELSTAPIIRMPKAIFYASRRGDGDAQHATLNSIRIQAIEAPHGPGLENFRRMTETMVNSTGLTEVTSAAAFQVKGHQFVRAEFERKSGALHYYQGMVQTEAGKYLLTIEWFALSLDELHTIGESLQKMEIREQE